MPKYPEDFPLGCVVITTKTRDRFQDNNDLPIYQYSRGFKGRVVRHALLGAPFSYWCVVVRNWRGEEKYCVVGELEIVPKRSWWQWLGRLASAWARNKVF